MLFRGLVLLELWFRVLVVDDLLMWFIVMFFFVFIVVGLGLVGDMGVFVGKVIFLEGFWMGFFVM